MTLAATLINRGTVTGIKAGGVKRLKNNVRKNPQSNICIIV